MRKVGADPAELEELLQIPPGELVVLVGAGISMFGATALPSGPDLLRSALRMLVDDESLADQLEIIANHVGFDELVPELVLQRFSDIFNGLPAALYRPFAEAMPNGIHQWLGRLCSRGATVLTTNFDMCLERASDSTDVENILHLHGSVDRPDSLMHVIHLIGQGLPASTAERAQNALDRRTLLVLGYSGNDEDVMTAVADSSVTRILWGVRNLRDRAITNAKRNVGRFAPVEFVQLNLRSLERNCHRANQAVTYLAPSLSTDRQTPIDRTSLNRQEALVAVLLQLEAYDEAIKLIDAATRSLGPPEQRCSLLVLGVFAARRSGDYSSADTFGRAAMSLKFRGHGILRVRLETELGLSYLDRDPPDIPEATKLLDRAYQRCVTLRRTTEGEIVDRFFGSAVHNLGYLAERQGLYAQALQKYRRALRLKIASGDLPYQISSERDVGLMLMLLDRPADAQPHLVRFRQLVAQYGDPYEEAFFHWSLGHHWASQGRTTEAREEFRIAMQDFNQLGQGRMATRANEMIESLDKNPSR